MGFLTKFVENIPGADGGEDGWLNKVNNVIKFDVDKRWQSYKDDPGRGALGWLGDTPLGTDIYNKTTGRDAPVLVEKWGGPANQTMNEADAAGIDTSDFRGGNSALQTIGKIAGAYGAGTALSGAGSGATASSSPYNLSNGTATFGQGSTGSTSAAMNGPGASSGGLTGSSGGVPWQDLLQGGLKGFSNSSRGGGGGGSNAANEQLLEQRRREEMMAALQALQEGSNFSTPYTPLLDYNPY